MMRKDVMRAVEILNRLENTASVVYSGASIAAPPVSTLLLLPPTVTMTVDQLSASIGDTLTYTVVISNISLVAITDLPFTDALPQGSLYLSDSFTINGSPAAPTVTGNSLTYTIPLIPAMETATLTFQVLIQGGAA